MQLFQADRGLYFIVGSDAQHLDSDFSHFRSAYNSVISYSPIR